MTRVVSLLFHDVYETHPSESGFQGLAADRYKLTVAEFDAQLAGLARQRTDRPILVTESLPERSRVPYAITVDDGGVSYYTRVAERLEARGWRGHCFVTTGMIGQPGFLDARQIRDLHRRGHIIGSHSVSHPTRFSACRREEMVREWEESRKVLADIVGVAVTAASVPGGYFSPLVASTAAEAGLQMLFNSEPDTRVRSIAGCTVIGRFMVRAGYPPDFAFKLGGLAPAVLRREWIVWNAKKILKTVLGDAYVRVTGGDSRRAESLKPSAGDGACRPS